MKKPAEFAIAIFHGKCELSSHSFHSFVHSFSKYLLNGHMAGIILSARNIAMKWHTRSLF